MGRIAHVLPAAPMFGMDAVEPDEWLRIAAASVTIGDTENLHVVGTSFCERALKRITGNSRVRVPVTVVLIPQADNPYDRNAIAVWAEGSRVGYLSRTAAQRYRDMLDEWSQTTGHRVALPGYIYHTHGSYAVYTSRTHV